MLLLAVAAAAQSLDPPSGAASPAPSLELPPSAAPAPIAPEVYSEDARGRVTLRATRLAAPLTVDGDLDEAVYRETKAITHFVQMEPREGQPATERTAAWLFFDDRNFYVSVRAYDSAPEKRVANELRRDSCNIFQNDNVTVSIDPLFTRRSGYFFQTNALGALRDQEVFDERNNNNDWNTVWFTRSKILRRRVVDGDGDSVPVAALQEQRAANLGIQPAADRALEERGGVNLSDSGGGGLSRHVQVRHLRDAGRRRNAGTLGQSRGQAVRHRFDDDQPRGDAALHQRSGGQRRRRRQVRPDA